MEEAINLFPLLIVVVAAFLVPLIISPLRVIPVVVGEILIGVLLGRSGFGLVNHEEFSLALLSEIGFAFLMFLSGLEIDFDILRNAGTRDGQKRANPIQLAVISFLGTILFALPVGFLLVRWDLASDPWLLALILSTTSLGIVVPVLKERGMSTTEYGQTVLLSALMADFVTMLLITVYVSFYSVGLTIEIMLIGVLFIAFLLTYRLGVTQINRPAVRSVIERLERATSQFKLRGAIAIMLAFVVLAESVDVELILGSFLAGVVISLLSTKDDDVLHEKLEAIGYGFFIPIFFITVGISFNFTAMLESPSARLLAPLLLVVAILIKLLSSLPLKRFFTWRETLGAGSLNSARLSLIIASAAIGLRIGVISEATNAAIIFVAAASSTLAPLAFNWIVPDREEPEKRRYLIYGASNIALQVAQELRKHGESVLFLEPEERLVKLIREENFVVLHGEGTRDCLIKAEIREIETLLVLSGNDDKNLKVAKIALDMGSRAVVALVQDPTRTAEFRENGIDAVTPQVLHPIILAGIARNPDVFKLITSTTDGQDIREFVMNNPVFRGRSISEIVFPGDSLVLTIRRNAEVRVPHGSTQLEMGDHLSIIGEVESLDAVSSLLES